MTADWQRPIILVLTLFVAAGAGLALKPYVPPRIQHALSEAAIVFVVVGTIHLLDFFVIHRKFFRAVGSTIEEQLEVLRPRIEASIRHAISESQPGISHAVGAAVEVSARKSVRLLQQANDSNLRACYRSRREARTDIEEAIESTRTDLLVLAVALTQEVHFERIKLKAHSILTNGSDSSCDVRLLLMDPLRSPALFRTILEEPPEKVREVLYHDRSVADDDDPYCQTELYQRVLAAANNFGTEIDLGSSRHLRFYRHAPSFWLLITDTQVFCQPYVMGVRDRGTSSGRCSGDVLPVFRFDASGVGDSLRQHFDVLWRTSFSDRNELLARDSDRGTATCELFERRGEWVQYAFEEGAHQRRATIRHICRNYHDAHIDIGVRNVGTIHAHVQDHSDDGLGTWVAKEDSDCLADGVEVDIVSRVSTASSPLSRAEQALVNRCLPRRGRPARVIRPPGRTDLTVDGYIRIGLKFCSRMLT